jgi:citrate synthase
VLLGTTEECARLLERGGDAAAIVREHREAGKRLPGFGHPVHTPVDPRAERILDLADERGVSGPNVALARALRGELGLTMNVSMPIAAVLLDLGFPAASAKAIPILARTASLLAHLAEERETPIGLDLARAAEEAVEYRRD